MTRRRITSGSSFEKTAGYSRALVDGDWVFVAGTTGMDYATMTMPEDAEVQTRNCFRTIEGALREAGASLADVVRVRYYVSDRATLKRLFPVFGEYFGDIRPAATAVICALLEPSMKIEIEATARKRSA